VFFAIWPDADIKFRLDSIAAQLRLSAPARSVPAENYHLTVAFIGEVVNSRLAQLLKIGRSQQATCCTITLNAIEYWAKPQIVVSTAQEVPAGLRSLWEQLREDLALNEFGDADSPAERPLRAHVTLARKVTQAPVPQAMSPIEWTMRSFSLICSDTGANHSAYTVVDTWSLLDERQNP
jgi:RNA 2',3'-cyclic 3'-phosphodiesterase